MKDIAVILHNIRSLHNVGSIFRTAEVAGVKKIYLTGITPTPLDRFGRYRSQLTKVSLGSEKIVAWEKSGSALKLIGNLKKDGYKVFMIEQSKKSTPYYKMKVRSKNLKVALIVGNEVTGLPSSILKRADKILEIPRRGKKESLNVSVACGIVLFRILYN